MRKTLRAALGTGLLSLPILVLGLTFATLASPVEAGAPPCAPCDPVELNCDGSVCNCQWGGYYKCVPN